MGRNLADWGSTLATAAGVSGPVGWSPGNDVNRFSVSSRWFRTWSSEPLVEAVRRGDTEAFGALVERHADRVFRLAYRLTRRRQDAEEVVQETFFRAYRGLRRFRGKATFASWLHRIAIRCAYDLLRAETRSPIVEETSTWSFGAGQEPPGGAVLTALKSELPGPDRLAASAEIQRSLDAALRDLTAMERTAFVLRHVEGFSIEEIAEALGSSRGGAKQAIFRAITKLRAQLAPLRESP